MDKEKDIGVEIIDKNLPGILQYDIDDFFRHLIIFAISRGEVLIEWNGEIFAILQAVEHHHQSHEQLIGEKCEFNKLLLVSGSSIIFPSSIKVAIDNNFWSLVSLVKI